MGVRILGKSEDPITEPIMLVTITGNNLRFRGDITARLLKARIDAGMENPEDRVFNWDPVVYALEHRAELVHDVLTVLRAYIHCKRRARSMLPMGLLR
jgi:putative DNA primase/helicase